MAFRVDCPQLHEQSAAANSNASDIEASKRQFVVASNAFTDAVFHNEGQGTNVVTIASTVNSPDPLSTILTITVELQPYYDSIAALSPHVVVALHDPSGKASVVPNAPCALAESTNTISTNVSIAGSTWRVQVGQCPQFTDDFVATSPKTKTVWLYVGMIALSTCMAIGGSALALYLMKRGARMRIADAKHEESTRAHKWIIGYGTVCFSTMQYTVQTCGRAFSL